MAEVGDGISQGNGVEEARARVRRTALLAVALTPVMLFISEAGGLSAEEAVALVAVGAVLGIGTFLVVDGVDFGDPGPIRVTVAALVGVALTFAGLILFVPIMAVPSLGVGAIAFVWAMVLTGVVRHYVLADPGMETT